MFVKTTWTLEELAQSDKVKESIETYIYNHIFSQMSRFEVIRVSDKDDEFINLIVKRRKKLVVIIQFPYEDPQKLSALDPGDTIRLIKWWPELKQQLHATLEDRKADLDALVKFEP